MSLSIIVALTDDGVIGKQGRLPWHLSEDLRRFKALTLGHRVLMGRKTWDSLPKKPLPGRPNLVLTRQPGLHFDGAESATDLEAALQALPEGEEHFVIGGRELFAAALPRVDRLYLTLIHHPFEGDVHFPPYDMSSFRELKRELHRSEEGWAYEFLDMGRQKA